jgi:formate-dependent nitrite reductase cytochrome c552 subunit
MPYRSEGGVKFTDHHIQSPLLDLSNSCAVCHRWSEQELLTRVESIQTKTSNALAMAEEALVQAHFDIAAAIQAGLSDDELLEFRDDLVTALLHPVGQRDVIRGIEVHDLLRNTLHCGLAFSSNESIHR